jgi:hypothetical protein
MTTVGMPWLAGVDDDDPLSLLVPPHAASANTSPAAIAAQEQRQVRDGLTFDIELPPRGDTGWG